MENASKALIMAGGILIGILILTLMATLFLSSREISKTYEQTKQSEAIQQFNVNFTKYLGQNLTIHQVVTITNFADENDVEVGGGYTQVDMSKYTEEGIETYSLSIVGYEGGYINSIKFTKVD